jgi:hypothetical protein
MAKPKLRATSGLAAALALDQVGENEMHCR